MIEDFEKKCHKEVMAIEKRLKSFGYDKIPKSLYEPCSYVFQKNGKLLRPLLVLITAKAVGGEYSEVRNAAFAVEVAHVSSLVHDDIMDNSFQRRGRPSLHKAYNLSTSIMVGDTLIFTAYDYLSKDCSVENAKELVVLFTKAAIKICEGQSMDMDFEKRDNVTLREYYLMIYKKTAVLTEAACNLSSRLLNASGQEIKAVSSYGKYLGIAFQIQDDVLDLLSEEKRFGKKVGSDFFQNKKNYIFLRALEKGNLKERVELLRLYNSKKKNKEMFKKYKTLCIDLGVDKDARTEIKKYITLALKSIKRIQENEGTKMMTSLAESLMFKKI